MEAKDSRAEPALIGSSVTRGRGGEVLDHLSRNQWARFAIKEELQGRDDGRGRGGLGLEETQSAVLQSIVSAARAVHILHREI
jgi:hypothetical protein